ncbi:MAG TPA: ATP phosphoribosyltransferase [Methanoculleus sp.]|nr:ATP phosphoribosyltransferase [Methanoculleus sp.]
MKSRRSDVLRLAVPNKGRIAGPVLDLVEKGGFHIESGGERRLVAQTCDPHVEILYARPIDIPEYVANGAADLGITGHDMVLERGSVVEEVLDLGMGRATLVLAVPDDAAIAEPGQLDGANIATEFPRITRQYFGEKGIDVTVVEVSGACEATPYLGIADAIVDLSSSGQTLKTNRLRVIDEILQTSTMLIVNARAHAQHAEKVEELRLALESVISARGQCYLMMNVHRDALQNVREVIPGLSGPTVMDVASSEHLVAVHAVVNETRIYRLISMLKRAGARDILVVPIERMVR